MDVAFLCYFYSTSSTCPRMDAIYYTEIKATELGVYHLPVLTDKCGESLTETTYALTSHLNILT
jgi:hypothetical protein